MAIKKTFGGQSILKPGSYSRTTVDNTSGAPLDSNNTLFLIGEAAKGKPGSTEGIVTFTAEQMSALVAKYGSGPIVDAAVAAIRPSNDANVGGAGRIMIYKTNASTQASLNVNEATDSNTLLVIKDKAWGVAGNNYTVTIANGTSSSTQKLITIGQIGGTSESLGENDGTAVLSIQYTGDASTGVAAISGASKAAKTLATTLAGDQGDGSDDLSITLNNYTMKELVDYINNQTGYTATLLDATKSAVNATDLDLIASTNIKASAVSLYRLQEEIVALINENSDRVEASLHATPRAGLPVNITAAALTGGARGASTNSNFSTGLAASLKKDINVIVPCISRDATADIADALTDASSSYTIASVLAALSSHLTLRSNIKNRKEAQGIAGFRDAQKADCYTQARTLADYQIQMCIQDAYVLDATGSLAWKQPHVLAAMMAGIRLGTDVGEPLTHKSLKVFGIGHVVNTTTGLETGDYDDALDVEDAIENGLLVAENISSGVRVVVDATVFGADSSFVYNRGSVIEAAQYVAKTLRTTAEQVFIGKKVSSGAALSIKNVIRAKLLELNAPEVNIITSSADAPNGFREDTFTVTVTGNTATVGVHIKPVQGLDWVFLNLELGDINQTA